MFGSPVTSLKGRGVNIFEIEVPTAKVSSPSGGVFLGYLEMACQFDCLLQRVNTKKTFSKKKKRRKVPRLF